MDLYRKVRLACSGGMSQREAARHFGISRDSVRKMLSFSVPPGYRRKAPVKRPKLDGFTGIIDAWLETDRSVHHKQRHTPKLDLDVYPYLPRADVAKTSATSYMCLVSAGAR